MIYHPGPDGRYTIGYYRGKPRHIKLILEELCKEHFVTMPHDTNDIQKVLSFISEKFHVDQINKAHRDVVHGYETGKYSKRGRPPGSRNRDKPAAAKPSVAAELAALQEAAKQLSELQEARANGDAAHVETADIEQLTKLFVSKDQFNNHVATSDTAFNAIAMHIQNFKTDIAAIQQAKPTIVHIQPVDAPVIDMGVQHMCFPDLVTSLRARQFNKLPLNAWLYGPAGTGKSKACEAAINAFGKKFYGNGKTLDKIELLGYQDGYGKYHRTQFREAFEHGHGYCADEIDSWSPEATTALQGSIAGDWAAFPDGMVKRHPDFIFIAAGNTTGKGATIEYVGRMQQDAAFLDRFVFIDWPHDNGLEDSLVNNKDWLAYVRHVRAKLFTSDIRNHLVTMRASIHGEALLTAGMPWDKVVNMCLRKGLPQNNWDKIK